MVTSWNGGHRTMAWCSGDVRARAGSTARPENPHDSEGGHAVDQS
jgi:hypothetical protein